MPQSISSSLEDYVEAIAEITAGSGHAHTKDIAERLAVKMPSVTGALRLLAKRGLITYNPNQPVELTAAGRVIAERVRRRHAVLKKFFHEVFSLSESKADETACKIEHVVDEEVIERFVLFSEAISGADAAEPREFLRKLMTAGSAE